MAARTFRNVSGETRWLIVNGALRKVEDEAVVTVDDDYDYQPHIWELVTKGSPAKNAPTVADSEGSK